MMLLSLSHDQSPEEAEAALYAALRRGPVIVHVNGFPAREWAVIVQRLPKADHATRLAPNVWEVTPPAHHNSQPDKAGPFLVSVMSGRFDAPLPKVRADLLREQHAGASLIFTTEQGAAARGQVLDKAGDGYGTIRDGGSFKRENTLLYRHADWELVDSGVKEITAGGATRGRMRFPMYATWAILRSRHNGERVLVIDTHMPAHLFPGDSYYDPRYMGLWLGAAKAMGAFVAQQRKAHPDMRVMVSADWNARQTAPWFLAAMGRFMPGLVRGRGYMFGNVWSSGFKRGAATTEQAAGSDHEIKRLTYGWQG